MAQMGGTVLDNKRVANWLAEEQLTEGVSISKSVRQGYYITSWTSISRGLQEDFLEVFILKYSLQIFREWGFQFHRNPCHGMGKLQLIGMEELALNCAPMSGSTCSIDRVPDNGVTYCLQMYANLVRAPGLQL